MAKNVKRLYRSQNERMIAGICGGLGDYGNMDPTIVRLIYVILTVLTGVVASVNSIDISTCSNLNVANTEYKLTTDIIDSTNASCIGISANNVTLDCQGNLIDGDNINSNFSIEVGAGNYTIKNCILNDWLRTSILVWNVRNGSITNVSINNTNNGISFGFQSNNVRLDKISMTNVVNYNLYIEYLYNISLTNSQFDTGGVYILDSYNISFDDVNISGADEAVYLEGSSFTGNRLKFNNNNWGFVTDYSNYISINISNSQFKENKYQDLLDRQLNTNSPSCDNLHLTNVNLSGSYPFGYYKLTSVTLSDQIFSKLILCNVTNSVLSNIEIIGSSTFRNNGLNIINSNNITLTNVISKNVHEGLTLTNTDNVVINNLDLRNISINPYIFFSDNITLNGIIASINSSFGGTYYISLKENNKFKFKNKSSFSTNYGTNFIPLGELENLDENQNLVLKIEQKDKDFAAIEYLKLKVCNETYLPKKAYFENSKNDILFDILNDDLNVVVANEENIILEFENISNCLNEDGLKSGMNNGLILEMKANEHKKPMPLIYPRNKIYYIYNYSNITVDLNIDGKINEVDGIFKPSFSQIWEPNTGHPHANTYSYIFEDTENYYFLFDITMDNTNETNEDWMKVIINDVDKTNLFLDKNKKFEKEFLINDNFELWGKCDFGLTSKVSYKHQTCEFIIPKYLLNDKLNEFQIQYYGTGGMSCEDGLFIYASNNINLSNSYVTNFTEGLCIGGLNNVHIYNNYFNNTNNLIIGGGNTNVFFNSTNTSGTNIVGGNNTGGNYWANPSGTGFSQTCGYTNGSSFCNTSYSLGGGLYDYLPLVFYESTIPITSPSSSSSLGALFPFGSVVQIVLLIALFFMYPVFSKNRK